MSVSLVLFSAFSVEQKIKSSVLQWWLFKFAEHVVINHWPHCPCHMYNKRESLSTFHLSFLMFPKYWCRSSEVQELNSSVKGPSSAWQPGVRTEVSCRQRDLSSISQRRPSCGEPQVRRGLTYPVGELAWFLFHNTSLSCSKTTGCEYTESSRELSGLFSVPLGCQNTKLTVEKHLMYLPNLYCECQRVKSGVNLLGRT